MAKQLPFEIEQSIKNLDFSNTTPLDEAHVLLLYNNLTEYLNLSDESKILNLISEHQDCHTFLNQLEASVATLTDSEVSTTKYDAVFSLFSDFYQHPAEPNKLLHQLSNSLNEYGLGVIDVFNAEKVLAELKTEETKIINGIELQIKNKYVNECIVREIQFEQDGSIYNFSSKSLALTLENFENIMSSNDLFLLDVFGDYRLKKFYKNESERLIMIFK